MKIHLDTDLGSDPEDVCALAYLLARDDVEITGITTCHEQGGRRAGYVLECLRLAGRTEIPVAAGGAGGIGLKVRPRFPGDESAFWGEPVTPRPDTAGAALDLIDASVDGGATVVAIGPMTNIALYEAMRPGRLARTGLVIMAGCIPPLPAGLPQWGPDKDWNLNVDPAAARRALERCDPLMVPLNVTLQVHLRAIHMPRLRTAGALGALISRQAEARQLVRDLRPLARQHALLPADLLNFFHDSLTCAVALGWDGAKVQRVPLRLEDGPASGTSDGYGVTGWSFAERVDPSGIPLRLVTQVDHERFPQLWLDTVAPQAIVPGERGSHRD